MLILSGYSKICCKGSSDIHSRAVLAGSSLRDAIKDSVTKFLDLERYQLFIFGSEASGVADRRSDIDIGIFGPQPVSGTVMQQIRYELETLRTLRAFDVVDFSTVDASFKQQALEHAERLTILRLKCKEVTGKDLSS